MSAPEKGRLAAAGPNPGDRGPEAALSTFAHRARTLTLLAVMALVAAGTGLALVYVRLPFIIGVLAGVTGVLVILARPYLGLLLYTVAYVLRPGELYPSLAVLHLERVLGVVTLASVAFEMYRREGKLLVDGSRQTKWFFALLVAMLLSVPFSFWVSYAAGQLVDMFKILAFYLMIVHLVNTRRRMKIFTATYLVLVVYLAATSLKDYYTGGYAFAQGIERAVGETSAGGDANALGATLGSAVPLFLLLARWIRGFWKRGLLLAGLAACGWTIVLTGSRASLLGLLTAMAFLVWTSRHRILWAMLALAAFAILFTSLPRQYKQRYSTIVQATSGDLDGSSRARLQVWKAGAAMVLDHPLFGVGAGCFGTAHAMAYSPPGQRNWLQAHSLYVQVPAELGLVGAVAFFGFMFQFLLLNRRAYREIRIRGPGWRMEGVILQGIFGGFVVLLVSGFFGHTLFRSTWYMFAAMGLALYRLHRDDPPAPADVPADEA